MERLRKPMKQNQEAHTYTHYIILFIYTEMQL